LITDLALYYEQANMRWVIIVPYRSQARHIITLLQNKLSATVLRWEERVSTVDSFQGSECEKVIYGFTRSNPRG
jgi:superfamily I DNA and/or RNA helicase